MEQTRERILEQVVELLADDSLPELTVADAAARAGVSVRTAYRYFPTKEALVDAFNQWLLERWGPVSFTAATDLPALARELYASFAANERFVRASRRTPAADQARQRRKRDQVKHIARAVTAIAGDLDLLEVNKVAAALHALISSEHYLVLRDYWGFTPEQAVDSTLWGIEAMLARLRREAKLKAVRR